MLRASLAIALLLPALASAECNCAGIGACLKVKMRLALETLSNLDLTDIPQECRDKADPAKLAELKEKMSMCQPKKDELPEDVQNVITEKITCAQNAVVTGCQNPDSFAVGIFNLLSSSGNLPKPGCDSGDFGNNLPPPIRARIAAAAGISDECSLKGKIDQLKDKIKEKFPELGETVDCLRKSKCDDMGKKLDEVKTECVAGNGCDGSNFMSGVMNVKKACLSEGPDDKMKAKYTEICNCIADQMEFPADVRSDVCTFPEDCVPSS